MKMVKVKTIQPAVINGSVWPKDSVVEVSDFESKRLIALKVAVLAKETVSAPEPFEVIVKDAKDTKGAKGK